MKQLPAGSDVLDALPSFIEQWQRLTARGKLADFLAELSGVLPATEQPKPEPNEAPSAQTLQAFIDCLRNPINEAFDWPNPLAHGLVQYESGARPSATAARRRRNGTSARHDVALPGRKRNGRIRRRGCPRRWRRECWRRQSGPVPKSGTRFRAVTETTRRAPLARRFPMRLRCPACTAQARRL